MAEKDRTPLSFFGSGYPGHKGVRSAQQPALFRVIDDEVVQTSHQSASQSALLLLFCSSFYKLYDIHLSGLCRSFGYVFRCITKRFSLLQTERYPAGTYVTPVPGMNSSFVK